MAAPQRMQFFITEEIGPNRSITPAGFLLCTDVPLARTGIMNYAPGETPVAIGPKGYVEIERNADEVFNPQSLATYTSAPFTLDHPSVDVIPTNWRDLAHGDVLNARRGDNELIECVVGDIMVKSPEAIAAIQRGRREVSVGYTCDYDEIEPGRGRQRNIIVNHVALVERGRCGPRCSIRDEEPENPMSATTLDGGNMLKRLAANLRTAFAGGDEAAVKKAIDGLDTITDLGSAPANGAGGSTININVRDKEPEEEETEKAKDAAARDARDKAIDKFMADTAETLKEVKDSIEELKKDKPDKADDEAILGTLQMEAPPGTNDAAITKDSTKDSALLAHSYQETVSMAEVLAPGIVPPTFDTKLPAARTFDSICKHRRTALSVAVNNARLAGFIRDNMPKGKTFDSMSCDETRTLFKASAAVAAAINNGAGKTADVVITGPGAKTNSKVTSIKELNALAKTKYKTAN